jgi:hypothetical protein
MRTVAFWLTACLAVSPALADPPRPVDPPVPVGKWVVEFANGVVEKVEIKKDGAATVAEPARTSDGKVTAVRGTFLFVCEDDRVERWTPVGKRMVVEHWPSADQYPNGTPVRGIADPTD